MGVYFRFKKSFGGFRKLVELLESTPMKRRKRMIEVGMQEDPDYTEKALRYILTFEDISQLPVLELADVIAGTPPQHVGYAIHGESDEVKQKFLSCVQPRSIGEVRDAMESSVNAFQKSGAIAKMIEVARKLEKNGIVKTKRIPDLGGGS
ncbi:MAG: FliG C-terminal domain-containing protein [Bdellovibrionia bacterium]